MSADFLNQSRQRAIDHITQGKSQYFSGATLEAKQEGYNNLKSGIQELVTYVRNETNPDVKKMATDKVKQYMEELEQMKNYLAQFQVPIVPAVQQQNQPQQQPKANGLANSSNQNAKNTDKPEVIQNDQNAHLRQNLQSAIVTEKPDVKWSDVAGLEGAKSALKEAVIMPIRFPELFQGARKPWMGILLYGPPGTGKTFLAKACATECDGTFFSVSSSDLISKFVGESERLIKELFQLARDKKPSIIFIDEIDSMVSARDGGGANEASGRVKTEFLVQMQGVGNNNDGVLVLGATNLPWALDPAIRRRFERRIYIPLPDFNGRLALLQNRLEKTPNSMTEQEIQELSKVLEGYSGSDLNTMIRDASFEPLRKTERASYFKLCQTKDGEKWMACPPSDPQGKPMKMMDMKGGQIHLPPVEFDDFMSILPKCKATVGQGDLKKYEDWTAEFGQEG